MTKFRGQDDDADNMFSLGEDEIAHLDCPLKYWLQLLQYMKDGTPDAHP